MDYATRFTSRKEVRLYANVFRKIFGLPFSGPVDPLSLLDKVTDVYGNVYYEIIEESELPNKVPARCIPIEDDGFLIQISEVVFEGAYERNVGGYRAHILHEIIHPFVDKMGFKPIMSRVFENNEIPSYMSLEWVVKAMTGEVMMPYEETIGLTEKELIERYGVSPAAAKQRLRY